jgi:hypothetical protein
MRKLPSVLAIGASALAIGVTVAFAQGGSPAPADHLRGRGAAADGARALAPDLPQLLSAFRREQTAADRLPGNPVEALAALGDARPGESPQFSRRLQTGDGPVYVWPETGGICYAWRGSGGCTPTSVLADNGVVVGLRVTQESPGAPPEVSLAGLARDGIGHVEAVFDGGTTQAIKIENNAFQVNPSSIPLEVRWTNRDGSRGVRELPSR